MAQKINPFIITFTGQSGCGKSFIKGVMQEYCKARGLSGAEPFLDYTTEGDFQNKGDFKPYDFSKFDIKKNCLLVPFMKYTERAGRGAEDRGEAISCPNGIPDECDIIYENYGYRYGVSSMDLVNALNEGLCPLIVLNNVRAIETIRKHFPTLSLFAYRTQANEEIFLKTEQDRNIDGKRTEAQVAKDARTRFSKASALHATWTENMGLFDNLILNVSEGPTDTRKQVFNILDEAVQKSCRNFLTPKAREEKAKNSAKLIIVAGSNAKFGNNKLGAKDAVVSAASQVYKTCVDIVPKMTTRAKKADDIGEMICNQSVNQLKKHCDIIYKNDGLLGSSYGLSSKLIKDRLARSSKNQMIAVSNPKAIRQLNDIFGSEHVMNIFAYSYGDKSPEGEEAFKTYCENTTLFDRTFLYDGSNKENLNEQLERVLRECDCPNAEFRLKIEKMRKLSIEQSNGQNQQQSVRKV